MTAITAHGTPVFAETAWYLALAIGVIKRRARGVKFLVGLESAQRFAFAAVRALRSVIDALELIVLLGTQLGVHMPKSIAGGPATVARGACAAIYRHPTL